MKRLFLILLLIVSPVLAHSASLEVGSGKTYATIALAYAAATTGDTILIYPGTYTESFSNISKSGITFRSQTSRQAIVPGWWKLSGDNLTIDGISFTGPTSAGLPTLSEAIQVMNTCDTTVINDCYFTLYNWQGVRVKDDAVAGVFPQNLSITNCLAENITKGFSVAADTLLIENNEINDLTRWVASDCDYMRVYGSNVTVRGNYLHGTVLADVAPSHVDCVQTYYYGGQYLRDAVFENNIFADAHQAFMANGDGISSHERITFRNNIFRNCNSWAIDAHDQHDLYVYHNTILDMTVHGVGFRGGSTGQVFNNIFYNAGSCYFFDDATGYTNGYNLIYKTTGAVAPHVDWAATDILDQNPLFVNKAGGDYKLQAGSPARDAGTNKAVVTDYDGAVRPSGSGYDIGAFEYLVSTVNAITVSGTLSPAVTGTYWSCGTWGGQTFYRGGLANYYIWYKSSANNWQLNTTLAATANGWNSPAGTNPAGSYTPYGTATGTATVALVAVTPTPTPTPAPDGTAYVTVTGTLNLEATGTYYSTGTYLGNTYYQRSQWPWWYLCVESSAWRLTDRLSTDGFPMYWSGDATLPGDYAPVFVVTGTATVSGEVTTPPNAPIVTGSTPTNDTTPTWSWSSGGGGNGTFRYQLDSEVGSWTTTTEVVYTPATALSEAAHTLYVQERDAGASWSASGSFAITIDLTGPTAPSVTGTTPTTDTTPTWSWTAGGGGNGTFRYQLDSVAGSWTETVLLAYTPGTSLSVAAHTLYVQERDAVGNWSASGSKAITITSAATPTPTPVPNAYPLNAWDRTNANRVFLDGTGTKPLAQVNSTESAMEVPADYTLMAGAKKLNATVGGGMVGADPTNLTYSDATTVQGVLEDIDAAVLTGTRLIAVSHNGGENIERPVLSLNDTASLLWTVTDNEADVRIDVSAAIVETDPVFLASEAYDITTTDTTHWDAAYTHSIATTNVHGLTFTAEGTGGGLDADTVDGSHAAAFWILASTQLAGDVTGLYGATVVGDDSHAHTTTTISGVDISADTNLTAGDALTLTDDDLDFDGGSAPGGELGGTWASPTVDSTHAGSAHHSAVTLGTDADVLLGLTTQQIDFDTQTANYIFAGPATGAAADPTFRALVAADMPATYLTAVPDPIIPADGTQNITGALKTTSDIEGATGIFTTSIVTPGNFRDLGFAVRNAANTADAPFSASTGAFSSHVTLSGTAANILLGSNYLSGDGGDEGIAVDASGNVTATRLGVGVAPATYALALQTSGDGRNNVIQYWNNTSGTAKAYVGIIGMANDFVVGAAVNDFAIRSIGQTIMSAGNGTANLTLPINTGDVTVGADLTVTGNDIKSSSATAITMSGANSTIAGDLTVGGGDQNFTGATGRIDVNGSGAAGVIYWGDASNNDDTYVEGFLATGDNEYLAHDVIRHTLTAEEASAGSFTEAWSKSTHQKVVSYVGILDDGAISTIAPFDVVYTYNGTTISVYRPDTTLGATGQTFVIYLVYEK